MIASYGPFKQSIGHRGGSGRVLLSPDGADRREAAFARRLDRLSRQVHRLERNLGIAIETLALFIRFWLTITPPLSADVQAAAQLKGRQRYEGFVEALGQRLHKGQSLLHEIPEEVDGHPPLKRAEPLRLLNVESDPPHGLLQVRH